MRSKDLLSAQFLIYQLFSDYKLERSTSRRINLFHLCQKLSKQKVLCKHLFTPKRNAQLTLANNYSSLKAFDLKQNKLSPVSCEKIKVRLIKTCRTLAQHKDHNFPFSEINWFLFFENQIFFSDRNCSKGNSQNKEKMLPS